AEDIPLPDASADLVVGAQMWHWVDQQKAAAEIARVLKPGGVVGIIWNLRDDRVPWVSELSTIADMPDSYKWCETHGSPQLVPPLGELTAREFEYHQPATVDSLVGLVGTFSHVALNPNVDQVKVDVRELALTHPDLRGRQRFTIPYVCRVFSAVRSGSTAQ
ncbi:MAG: class I SAM-dependent methyltransferase, partial [Actinobacteria bacterium]|nr:class I SAM-dependent methyltransferase [Actinomycetota bacterium]